MQVSLDPSTARHPKELGTLLVTIVVAAAVLILFTPFTLGGLLFVVLLGVGMNYFSVTRRIGHIRRMATPVERLPDVAQLVASCRERLDVTEAVEVYVTSSPVLNAYAVGFSAPYLVVLHSALLEQLDRDELSYVVGHELAHVKFRHTTILGLIGQLGTQTYGVPLLSLLLRGVFLSWMRVTEHTADRAGLIACGRLDKALATQLVLAVGAERARRVDVGEVVRYYREHDVDLAQQLGDVLSTHPRMEARLDAMVDYAFAGGRPGSLDA
jgi:Zn-dependent protease with chaperone function